MFLVWIPSFSSNFRRVLDQFRGTPWFFGARLSFGGSEGQLRYGVPLCLAAAALDWDRGPGSPGEPRETSSGALELGPGVPGLDA